MKNAFKDHLIKIANKLTAESTLEDVYVQLSLLSDIEESEQQEKEGETLTQLQVEQISQEWLK